jgi:hypothetical protein
MAADFPFARSLVVVRNQRTVKKTGLTTREPQHCLSSIPPRGPSPEQWVKLTRGHRGGVENRNHWRRAALMGEDRSRSRKPNLLANPALIRNALLALLPDPFPNDSLPEIRGHLRSKTRPLPPPHRPLSPSKQKTLRPPGSPEYD